MQWSKEKGQTTFYKTSHQKTKDRAKQIKPGVKSCAPEGYAVHTPRVKFCQPEFNLFSCYIYRHPLSTVNIPCS